MDPGPSTPTVPGAATGERTDRDDGPDGASVAARVERHEAEVWARSVEAAGRVAGNPLGATVDREGAVPLPALTAVDSDAFNRVVGLGAWGPVTDEDIGRIAAFYRALGQVAFRVEIAPGTVAPDVAVRLATFGLRPVPGTVTKLWRRFDDDGAEDAGDLDATARPPDLRRLTAADADAVARLNIRAWGSWQASVSLGPWFGAPVGTTGFTHYGAYVDDRLVCTGAMAVDGDLAWIGFDATDPRYRSRQLRRALTSRRIADALAAGCRVVHAEADSARLTSRARMLDSRYERRLFVHHRTTAPG